MPTGFEASLRCCWELFKAHELGLVSTAGALMITGHSSSSDTAPVHIENAHASDPEELHFRLFERLLRSF